MKPIDILCEAITYGICFTDGNRKKGYEVPGGVIKKMGAERRAVLADLKSSDIQNVRMAPEEVMDAEWMARCEYKQILCAFDRKILKT